MNRLNIDLKAIGIESLNPMQSESLEKHLLFSKIMIVSPTGSGKSLAYLLPALEKLSDPSSESETVSEILILSPTRELALQIEAVYKSLKTNKKIITLYGGHSFKSEALSLQHPSQIIIATPGRLADHISRKTIDLSTVKHLIVDEFDKLSDMGFDSQTETILNRLTSLESTTMTSATTDCEIPDFMRFTSPHIIKHESEKPKKLVTQIATYKNEDDESRPEALYDLLTTLKSLPTLIFCNFRESTELLSEFLWDKEVVNEFYHGGLEQQDRERALIKFRNGSANILIATDIASRGLDISGLHYVIHFEKAQSLDAYTHRSGRVARMENEGVNIILSESVKAAGFVTGEEATSFEIKNSGKTIPYPEYGTLYISAGKKNKISKGDIVGLLTKVAGVSGCDIGVIAIRDKDSYVAIKNCNISSLARSLRGEKLKRVSCRFSESR